MTLETPQPVNTIHASSTEREKSDLIGMSTASECVEPMRPDSSYFNCLMCLAVDNDRTIYEFNQALKLNGPPLNVTKQPVQNVFRAISYSNAADDFHNGNSQIEFNSSEGTAVKPTSKIR